MPKVAIISDIHANLPAFKAVLKEIQASGANQIAVLGDIVGYGASPAECVELCCKLAASAVAGNHDVDMQKYRNGHLPLERNWQKDGFLAGLVHAAVSLNPRQAEWLAALPYAKLIKGAVIAHGSLHDPKAFYYIDSDCSAAPTLKLLASQEHKIGFFGHTHEQGIFHHPKTKLIWESETTFTIPADQPCAITVGSVGQPRSEYERRAGWVLWDPETRRVELRKTEYNRLQAAQDIVKAGLPAESALRLMSDKEYAFLIQ
jgi:predicted phosphodiesterase